MKAKKIISILLTAALVLQMFSFTAFAGEKADKPVYTAIGDSTVVGFHPEDMNNNPMVFDKLSQYIKGYKEYCYPERLSKKTGWDLNNVGIVGLDSTGLAELLTNPDKEFGPMDFTIFCKKPNTEEGHEGQYINAIQAADYITLNIGSNDLLKTTLSSQLMSIIMNKLSDPKNLKIDEALIQELLDLAEQAKQPEAFKVQVDNYTNNYETIITNIKGYNPDAQLILVGCYNPFSSENTVKRIYDAILSGEIWARLGGDFKAFRTLLESLLSQAQLTSEEQAEASALLEEEVVLMEEIAETPALQDEVTEAEMQTFINDLVYTIVVVLYGDSVQNFIDQLNDVVKSYAVDGAIYVDVPGCLVPLKALDMHPTEEGNAYIADQIYKAITFKCSAKVIGYGGTIKCDSSSEKQLIGSDVTYTITPKANYVIDKVLVNGEPAEVKSGEGGTSILEIENINSDQCITVSFKYESEKKYDPWSWLKNSNFSRMFILPFFNSYN